MKVHVLANVLAHLDPQAEATGKLVEDKAHELGLIDPDDEDDEEDDTGKPTPPVAETPPPVEPIPEPAPPEEATPA